MERTVEMKPKEAIPRWKLRFKTNLGQLKAKAFNLNGLANSLFLVLRVAPRIALKRRKDPNVVEHFSTENPAEGRQDENEKNEDTNNPFNPR